ncbi:hypothetical protein N7513_000589 [Penicillium frequentans]|nr:hypothetical protein N7513_000589 [Penicillium glabrum]
MYECATCTDTFYYGDDCDEHMDHYGHWIECDTCNSRFRSQRSCHQHMNALGHHAPQFECETCTGQFFSQNAVNNHMNSMDHWATYCAPCGREFKNSNNLRMVTFPFYAILKKNNTNKHNKHRNSRIHRGTGFNCPFCQTAFVTASGVSHHVETGSCPNAPNLNRESLLKIVQASDRQGLITNKQIGWQDEEHMEYIVTDRAHNGYNWECYICHREFNTSKALNQHINSPVHKQKAYHCPNSNCPKEFISLAGLFSHLESESCAFMRFERMQQVQVSLNDAIRNRRQIAF